eukprot:TRINITY_DN6580_c0_g5_i1.p1 TRINITY_DN6580_c0_g5~~TRINITY_DN6580_c0_g5_i1.p1  ORF type:complete len:129 (+),score=7.66 TRINITY_DN6580_c0_g5_i1:59-445(+)
MNATKDINRKYLYSYVATLLLSAVASGHYLSFAMFIGFRTAGGLRFPLIFIPGIAIGNIIIGILPKINKRTKIIIACLLVIPSYPLLVVIATIKPSKFLFYAGLILSLIHICRCRRYAVCRSRWSPYH